MVKRLSSQLFLIPFSIPLKSFAPPELHHLSTIFIYSSIPHLPLLASPELRRPLSTRAHLHCLFPPQETPLLQRQVQDLHLVDYRLLRESLLSLLLAFLLLDLLVLLGRQLTVYLAQHFCVDRKGSLSQYLFLLIPSAPFEVLPK